MTQRIAAILLAGGTSQRFRQPTHQPGIPASQNKLLALLQGRPVLWYSLNTLLAVPQLAGVVVVARPAVRQAVQSWLAQRTFSSTVPVTLTDGGDSRRRSVAQGLAELARWEQPPEAVLVHDGARPLLTTPWVEHMLNHWHTVQPRGIQGVVAGHVLADTLKREQATQPGIVQATVNRAGLWQVQTPQLFAYETLTMAHAKVPETVPVTDDAQLLEIAELGPVELMPAPPWNLKITQPDDLLLAEAMLSLWQNASTLP